MKRIWALLIALVLIAAVVFISTPSINEKSYESGYSSYHYEGNDSI